MKVVCIDLYKEGDNPNFLHYYNNKYLTIGKVYHVLSNNAGNGSYSMYLIENDNGSKAKYRSERFRVYYRDKNLKDLIGN